MYVDHSDWNKTQFKRSIQLTEVKSASKEGSFVKNHSHEFTGEKRLCMTEINSDNFARINIHFCVTITPKFW